MEFFSLLYLRNRMPLRSRPSLGSSQNKIPTAFRLFYIHSVFGYVKLTFV